MTDSGNLQNDRSLMQAKRFDAICDEFEGQYMAGNNPEIESFLLRVDDQEKQPLLIELIAIELHHRRQRGETIVLTDYQSRFPDLSISRLEETIQLSMIKRRSADEKSAGLRAEFTDVKPQRANAIEAVTRGGPTEHPGTIIAGRYKLLEAIGEGGMGSVWVAEQSQPVKRKVALKLIKAGMDSKSVVARFEAERQALAVMDHPNIAKVLDGGLTEHGRPYFAMEYVKGIPITEYCDACNLSVPERLHLFAQVCQAVQHAHQKGIIHRDLKPSNILVAPYDDKPVPKVIDFGLAKAIHQALTDNTLYTAHDMVLGTPLYMSPEQAQLNNIDIDTRSDVYSLGVLLYELLTGSTPLEKQRFRQAAWDEMRRMIREEDPPLPSQRLSSAETLPSVSAGRRTEPAKLTKLVRGELDWIVMKALDKDRTRRYETANGFAADVLRYLAGEPVSAAPPSTVYRLQKFVRRNNGKVITAGLVLATLLAGIVSTTWQWYRAKQLLVQEEYQRTKAEKNELAARVARTEALSQKAEAIKQANAAREQEAEAKRQAEIAEAVAKFQTDMLSAVDPNKLPKDQFGEPMKDAVTVVQVLDTAAEILEKGNLKNQPLVEANIRKTIGNTLSELGRYDHAEPQLRKSLAIFRDAHPKGHLDIALGLNDLAAVLLAKNRLDEAEVLFREALDIRRAAYPVKNPVIAGSMENLALVLKLRNKLEEAEPLYREALDILRKAQPKGHPDTALCLGNLAVLLLAQNRLTEAEPLFREALQMYRMEYPDGHLKIALGLHNLAGLLRMQNKYTEAESIARESVEVYRKFLPATHPDIGRGLNNLAIILEDQNKFEEVELLYREALEINRTTFPAGHPMVATSLNNLSQFLRVQNKLDEAELLQREALTISRASLPADHPDIAIGLHNMALLLHAQKKYTEAESLYLEALAIWRAALPTGHPHVVQGLRNLADLYAKQRQTTQELPVIMELLELSRSALPKDSPEMAGQLAQVSQLLLELNKWDDAEPLIRECLAIREKTQPDDWRTFNTKSMLGGVLLGQKKYVEAEPLLLSGYEGMKQRESSIPPQGGIRIPEALDRLIELYNRLDRPDDVEKYRQLRTIYSSMNPK